ncbi:MAG: hypothetical protein JRI54_06005 [Deltaproteobacteria bacterium]|nr:hypothetical protein [Deltaproteobacteria bacterium]
MYKNLMKLVFLVAVVLAFSLASTGLVFAANPYAGKYEGTFTGGYQGTWTATVADDGSIADLEVSLLPGTKGEGSVSKDGKWNVLLSADVGEFNFDGQVDKNLKVKGSWEMGDFEGQGKK